MFHAMFPRFGPTRRKRKRHQNIKHKISQATLLEIEKLLEFSELSNVERKQLLDAKLSFSSGLTSRQLGQFNSIALKYTPKAILRRKEWTDSYDEKKRQIVEICVNYYMDARVNAPHLARLALQLRNDPELIPSKKQYRRMCENKYAKKVIAETFSPAKYKVGTVVVFRTSAPLHSAYDVPGADFFGEHTLPGDMALVIEAHSSPVLSPTKGSKKYKVLPFGKTNVVEVQERFIKRYKK